MNSVNEDNSKKIKARELVVGVFFSFLFAAIAARSVYLHVLVSEMLAKKAKSQYTSHSIASGKRGTIYDINRQELATSTDTTSIGAFPIKIENKSQVAGKLAKILGIKRRIIEKKLSTKQPFVWIKRKVSPKLVASLKALDIKGLEYIGEHKRAYPNRSLAAQLIGFTGTDEKGLEGLEYLYNDELAGASDEVLIIKDALGRGFHTAETQLNGFNGNDITLTIDKRVQFIAESYLKSTAEEYEAKYGTAVVMNPNDGSILAIAQYPAINPNMYNSFDRSLWRNRAVTDPFEPGSTLKIFLAAAALESGICTPGSIFFCENGKYRIGSKNVRDTHPEDWLSLKQIIKLSSNIGAVKISETIGREVLYKALTDFGFGKKTKIDCPGETNGILSHYTKWSALDAGAISFGQGVSVSAVQLLNAVSIIANGGNYVQPHILSKVSSPSGRVIKEYRKPSAKRIISVETADKLKNIMASVTKKGGTGVNAALQKYTVCGKTGTAQKINETGRYSADKFTASFVGFAPLNKPEIAVLVVLDEPEVNHYGGTVAAPAFRRIVHDTLNYMNVPPEIMDNTGNILVAQRSKRKNSEAY